MAKLLSKKDRLLGVKDVEGSMLSIGDRVLISKGFREVVLRCWFDTKYLWASYWKPNKYSPGGYEKMIRVSPNKCIKPVNQKLPKLLEKIRQRSIEKDEEE